MNKYTLEDVLFPVRLKPVYSYFGPEESRLRKISRFKAVVAEDKEHVFCVVAADYKLVTNQEAIGLGRICFEKVFNLLGLEAMVVFNIVMPKTRSFCHIDYVHPESSHDFFDNDPWTPYLRITNSYNRMFALNFDLGFCRGICKNGIIFGTRNIEFKFHHSRRAKKPSVEFNLRVGELATLEAEFIESLRNLKRFHVPSNVIWALACKVFGFNVPEDMTEAQREIYSTRQNQIRSLASHYFSELGENGYAAMNVLTDYASRPVGIISPEGRIDSFQRKAGNWVAEFVDEIEKRDFSFDKYLGEYNKLVA